LARLASIIALIVGITVLAAVLIERSNAVVYEDRIVLALLNTIFLSGISFVIAFLSAEGYLRGGAVRMLLLGSAVLSFGVSSLIAGWIIFVKGPNAVVTMHNTGVFVASLLYLGSVNVGNNLASNNVRRTRLLIAYAGIVILEGLLTYATLTGMLPVFFIQGVGPTLVRQIILGAGTVLFAASAIAYGKLYKVSRSSVLYWYSVGLFLITLGLVAIFFQANVGSILGWVGRFSQYLGSLYLLASVVVAKQLLEKK